MISGCLQALCAQIGEIDEIIVVDNGSHDRTREIVVAAALTEPKLRLLDEPRPGLIPARNAGIAAARHDLVARIDADTYVTPGWARAIKEFFAAAPARYGAATGSLIVRDGPFQPLANAIATGNLPPANADGYRVVPLAMGANMALRRAAWDLIAPSLLDRPGIAEDLDISLALAQQGKEIARLDEMTVTVSRRRNLTSPASHLRYVLQTPRTVRARLGVGKRYWQSVAMITVWQATHLVFWLPHRAYDESTGTMSARQIFRPADERAVT